MSTPHDNGQPGGELPVSVVMCVTVVMVALIAGTVSLALAGKPISDLVVLTGAVVLPILTTLLAVRNSRGIQQVSNKVDAKINNLITDKTNLEHQVSTAGLTPVTATVSFDPDSTGSQQVIGVNGETNPPTNPFSVAEILRRNQTPGGNQHGR